MCQLGGRGTAGSRHTSIASHCPTFKHNTCANDRIDVTYALHSVYASTTHCACQSLTVLGVHQAHASTALHSQALLPHSPCL